MSLGKTYLDSVITKMTAYKVLGDKTFEQLDDIDFHYAPNEESNSIAIIVHHVSGNMLSRWINFLTEDGEKEWRQRDDEFEIHQLSKQQIIEMWNKGWTCMFDALGLLSDEDLMKTITIRNEPMSAIDAINRQLAHYPYHVGQIVYVGKILKNHDWKNLSVPKKKA
jgi:uncharacterized protein DUF1572